jgi:alkylation response protein AidB-like acyl-CoA dehydrogenase
MKDTPEQAEFREYCRRWLEENRPAPPAFRLPELAIEVMTEEQRRYLCAWQRKCYEAGLVGTDYPKAYGGGGHTGYQRIATQEMSRAQVPYLINVIGLGMAAPTILHHGSEEQKTRFLGPLLAADEIWCQGFSEPNAGSDLASVQTSAVREGDNWVINGHKVWTSLAHFASWMILLTRTGREHKYEGLTYFISPIAKAAGVTVRPLIKMTGQTGFNEVIFENVVVPDKLRLDAVGKGWTVAMTTLLHERGAAEGAGGGGGQSVEDRIEALIALAKRTPRGAGTAWDEPVLRDKIMQIVVRTEGFRQTFRRARVEGLTDHPMRIPLQSKLLISEIMQDLAGVALEVEGAYASLYLGDERAPDDAEWPLAYMNSYGITIAAGTSEVQRNILGERVLGLAKSK